VALAERDERHADRLQLLEQRDEMFQVASEPVQPPADQHVEPAALGIPDQLVERGPLVFGAGDALIDVLDGRPPASRHVPSQFGELVFRLLVGSGGRCGRCWILDNAPRPRRESEIAR